MIGDSPDVRDALARLGGTDSLADAYLAATFGILALIAAGYAVQAVLRLRGEETGGRAEPLLATAVSRTAWALSHTAIALAGTAALLAVAGLTAGIGTRRDDGRRRPAPAPLRRRARPDPGRVGARRRGAGALRPGAAGDHRRLGRARPLPRARPSSARCSSSAGR